MFNNCENRKKIKQTTHQIICCILVWRVYKDQSDRIANATTYEEAYGSFPPANPEPITGSGSPGNNGPFQPFEGTGNKLGKGDSEEENQQEDAGERQPIRPSGRPSEAFAGEGVKLQ